MDRTLRTLHLEDDLRDAEIVRDVLEAGGVARVGQLFEAFYATKAEGVGMGLSISRSIIEAHGGRLWASPNEARGAVFRFSLPLEGAAST